ncbi:MAG: tRNA dihydrouridine synthase DusB [Chthoniobacterales bacterium]|nr:tRNA dihydrouridine synthase DusB [Chthoniobacterales bacterium]
MNQPPLFLAPMAGVTNSIFRQICKAQGADILTSEFVSADGILHRNSRTREMLQFQPSERPFGVQLFGADPEILAKATSNVIEWVQPDFIDINFGCPVNKVVCKFGGSALLRHVDLLQKVAKAVVHAAAPLPVTAKIRIGWDENSINAVQVAKILEDTGITRITVHGRTRQQGYSGLANWDVIAQVVQAVHIPVIGNGDITDATTAIKRLQQTKVAGLMIGRAAMNRPWIFRQIRQALLGQSISPEPSLAYRWQLILDHCKKEIESIQNEELAMRSMRLRLMAYTKNMPNSRNLREKISHINSLSQLQALAEENIKIHSDILLPQLKHSTKNQHLCHQDSFR